TIDQVSQGRTIENLGRRIPHVQKHFVESTVVGIAINQDTQLSRIPKRRQWSVNQADDFAQPDLRWRPAQAVSALGSSYTLDDARVLQFQQYQLQKLLGEIFFIGNIPHSDGTLGISPR